MKRLLFVILTFLGYNIAFAQKSEGNWSLLKLEYKSNIEIDYSHAVIMGMDEEDFAQYEEDWLTDKPEINTLLVANTNIKLNGCGLLKQNSHTFYTIKLLVQSISSRGDFVCSVELKDSTGVTHASATGLKSKGGRIGSKLNLIKDGARRMGSSLGAFLKKKY